VLAASCSALLARPGHALTSFGDVFQLSLVAAAAILFLGNATRSRGKVRGFWSLMALGFVFWLGSLGLWAYFEVLMQRAIPDSPLGDTLLFLKLVPITAALALEPQTGNAKRPRIFGVLDISFLLIYWLYLYTFWVLVYRLDPNDLGVYNFHFNVVDAVGNALLLVAVSAVALRTQGAWRKLYWIYFAGAALYCIASVVSNVAIDIGKYYTGSLYDVPLIGGMAGFVCLGFAGRRHCGGRLAERDEQPSELPSDGHQAAFWPSRLAMGVTLSTPVIGLWLVFQRDVPDHILRFRILATLVAMLALTVLLFFKQDILSADLMDSLQNVSQSYTNLTRFRDRLIQSEKLASLGHLLAGVANEIKKALTVTMEYSARLNAEPSSDARAQSMAGKIDHYARRTSGLVENMLSFAQETPLQLSPMAVRPVLESALNLSRAGKASHIRIQLEQLTTVSPVSADASQLLQVFLQILGNAVDALEEVGGGTLLITLLESKGKVEITFADSGPGMTEQERVFEPFYTTKTVGKGTGLGLSTCYGIVSSHGGEISCENRAEGGAVFVVSLPCAVQESSAPEAVDIVAVQES
jgi:signal transduction histidine kinase